MAEADFSSLADDYEALGDALLKPVSDEEIEIFLDTQYATGGDGPDEDVLAFIGAMVRDAEREIISDADLHWAKALAAAPAKVEFELATLIAKDRAREIHATRTRPALQDFDMGTLAEVLARPEAPPARIEGLVPWNASVLISAQHKTGKTTLSLNLVRSLLTGEPFLGTFDVIPIKGRVAFLNFEVSAAQLARWADEVGIDHDRLVLVNLRGSRNPFNDPKELTALGAKLRAFKVESVIVDPFGRAYTDENQNDPGKVERWLVQLDQFARESIGAMDLFLTAHTGWNGERTRGASSLEGWPDSIISLVKGDDGSRYLRATGRDVDVREDRLAFDSETRILTMSGTGSRKDASDGMTSTALRAEILAYLHKHPGAVTRDIRDSLTSGNSNLRTQVLKVLVTDGRVTTKPNPGKGGGTAHYLP